MDKYIITISRQCGSGGHTIGKELAERLGILFYDKKLMEIVSERSSLPVEVVEQQGEYVPDSLLYSLSMNISYGWNLRGKAGMTLPDQINAFQTELIKELADKTSCVIVGRCADYILRNCADCIHVFIHADLEDRKKRVILEHGIVEADAEKHILDRDKKRGQHYKYYTDRTWGMAENYDICLNSSYYGTKSCVDIIMNYIKSRYSQ